MDIVDVDLIEPMCHDELPVDVSEQEETIRKKEDTIVDLQNLHDEITSSGGVNKTLAIAIESACEGLLGEKYPVISFTQDLSKTNYEPSIESIEEGIISAVSTMVYAASAMMKKIVEWMRSIINSIFDRNTQEIDIATKTQLMVLEILKIEESSTHLDVNTFNKLKKEIHDESFIKLNSIHSDLLADIVNRGHATRAFESLSNVINGYLEKLHSKMVLFENMVNIVDAKKIVSQGNTLISPIATGSVKTKINAVVKGTDGTIRKDLPLFKDKVYAMSESKIQKPSLYNSLFLRLRSEKLGVNDLFVKNHSLLDKNLQAIHKKLDALTIGAKVSTDKKAIEAIRKSNADIKIELVALQAYVNACARLSSVNRTLVVGLFNLVNHHYKKMMHMSKTHLTATKQAAIRSSQGTL